MNNSSVLPVNPIETAESAAHAIQGTTQVQICPTGPGFGLLAMILGYPYTPFEGHITEAITSKIQTESIKAPPQSPHERRLLKIIIENLATGLPPTVW